jgi:hypothetical protein
MATPLIEGSLRMSDGDSGFAQKKRKAALRTSAINQSISDGRGIGYYALAGGGPEALAR